MDMDKISIKKLVELAGNNGLSLDDAIIFSKFMTLRFPCESSVSYVLEWIKRFRGNPKSYMDLQSLKIYEGIVESYVDHLADVALKDAGDVSAELELMGDY